MIYRSIILTIIASLISISQTTWGAAIKSNDWYSFTMDNDFFVGNDYGYTNGLFFAHYKVDANNVDHIKVKSQSIGQVMMTPKDITDPNPDPRDVPYSGLLYYNRANLDIQPDMADYYGVSIGIVGPLSGAADVQTIGHRWMGSDEPKGWGTQRENEPVFALSRSRAWRQWHNRNNRFDVITTAGARLGNLETSINASLYLRFGQHLDNSYATSMLTQSRTSNPISLNGGWYSYISVSSGYVFHQIFMDGNSFDDDPSVPYKRETLGLGAGLAYSFEQVSVTVALYNLNAREHKTELDDAMRFGTITLAWRE